MTLVAPVDPTAGKLFKWENGFSWAYTGDVADGIKERVKNAGGNVTGDLCCRLAWYNHDDLDLHMVEPDGNEIYFWNKGPSGCGGRLDVDMNAGSGQTREPVENIFYGSKNNMKEGIYKLFVHQFSKRESTNVGFDVEMDFMGEVRRFSHPNALSSKTNAVVAKFKYSKAAGIEYIESLPHSEAVRTEWNIPTQTFHNVNLLMLSPNHWNTGETLADKLAFQGTGNKHYFFILDKCLSDEAARPFYNEFLKQELDQHRKVFEMVGSKMKVDDAADQLSGLGFSSTLRNHVVCRVKGSFSRLIKIVF